MTKVQQDIAAGRLHKMVLIFLNSPWAVASVLFLAAALRLFMLGAKSLWHDEAWSLFYAQTSVAYQFTWPTNAPPLYHLLLHYWLAWGECDAFLRLPSALAGIAAVWVTFLIGQRLAGRRMGLVLGLLTATSPLLIWHAQEARYYSLLYFFSTLSLYLYLRARDSDDWWMWAGYGISSLLCLYTHYYSLLLFLVQNLDFLLALRRQEMRHRWKRWLLVQAGLMVAFLPWFLYFLSQARATMHGETYYPRPGFTSVVDSYLAFVFGRVRPVPEFMLALLLGLVGAWGLGLALRRRQPMALWLLLLIVPVGLAYLISLRVPIYETKHLIASSLACHVLLAYGIALPRPWKLSAAALVIVMGPVIVSLIGYYLMPSRQDWRQAAWLVETQQQPGDVILFDGRVGYLGFSRYYEGGLDMYGLYDRLPPSWQVPGAAEYPPQGDFWANYDEIGSYFPQTLPVTAHWWRQPDEVGDGYRRTWLVLFWSQWPLIEHEARLGANCYSATDKSLGFWGEIQLYQCDLKPQS